MKIHTFSDFVKLPAGTIYSHYEPCICTGLFRKGDTITGKNGEAFDFYEASLIAGFDNENLDLPVVDDT